MARLRQRQKEEIVRRALARVSQAAGGTGGTVTGVSSYNGRTGAVVSTLTDVPTHKTTHQSGGSDEISVAGLAGVLANPQPPIIGAGAAQAVAGNDARLADARAPLAHAATHAVAGSDPITIAESQVTSLAADLAARVLSSDSRLSDVRVGKGAYDPGTVTLSADQYLLQDRHLYLTGAERLTATGTAEVLLTDMGNTAGNCLGTPKSPNLSFTVMTDYFLDVIKRLNLVNQVRSTLQGTADLILTDDFQTRSRLVLAGMG